MIIMPKPFASFISDDKKYVNALVFFLCTGVIVILSFGNFSYAVTDGIKMFFLTILPALLPFSFLSSLMSSHPFVPKRTGKAFEKIFGVDKVFFYPFVMSLLCGYPIGAKIISDISKYGDINPKQNKVACILCSTPSVSFCVSVIGRVIFSDIAFGIAVYVICVFSSSFVAFVYSKILKSGKTIQNLPLPQGQSVSFYSTVEKSMLSVLSVGGIIVLFYILSEILLTFNALGFFINSLGFLLGESNAKTLCLGVIELTKGLNSIAVKSLPLVCFMCAFGGFSVIMQSMAFLKTAKIKTATFLLSKIASAVLSVLISLPFSAIF